MFALTRSVPRIAIAILFISLALAQEEALSQCEDAKVVDPSSDISSAFGFRVAIHNGYAVIGAPGGGGANDGRAYVFKRVGDNWDYEATLQGTGAVGYADFGALVAIHNDRVLVGEFATSPFTQPSVHVFRRSGTSWTKETELTGIQGPDEIAFQINSLAYDGTYAVIGNEEDRSAGPGSAAGALYVFRRNGTAWTLQDQILLSPAPQNARLGSSVSIDGDFIAAGAAFEATSAGLEAGAVYVFERSNNGTPSNLTDDFWTQGQRLTRSNGSAGEEFGHSVSISGNTIAATSEGSAGVVVYRKVGTTYVEEAIVACGQNGVAWLSGSELLCGSPYDSIAGPDPISNVGAVYLYRHLGSTWTFQDKLLPSNPTTSDLFGFSIARSGDDICAGASAGNNWNGAAYIFKLSGVCSDSACESDPKCHGSCCNGGSCTPDVWEPDCAGADVTYQGSYSQCQVESNVDTCTDGYDDDCDGNTDCADDGCATLPACIRACCFATSSCLNLWVEDCAALGGLPGAAGSTCAATQCFPTGACCLDSGGCQNDVSPTACQNGGGSYLGFASTCQNFESGPKCHDGLDNDCDGAADCADNDCSTGPSCTGACCYPLGSCTGGVSDDFCTTGGGTYQGNGTSCSGVSCPQPEGACCTTSGGCAELVGSDCQVVPNSAWAGPFTTCLDSFPTQELSGSTCCDNFDNDCDGAADLDDDDCTSVVCSAELRVAPVPHDVPKNRYISFTAEDKQTPVAIKVTRVAPPFGDVGWVGVPDSRGLAGLKTSPVMRVWTDMAVHVGDCAIIPNATYELRTTTDGGVFSQPFVVSTVAKPAGKDWGDTVGVLAQGAWTPPNGFANVQDVVAVLHNIQALPGAPHASVVDLQAISSSDPCLNRIVNTADVLIEVRAVAGNAYPFTANPAACTPCP